MPLRASIVPISAKKIMSALYIQKWKKGEVDGLQRGGKAISLHVRRYVFEKFDSNAVNVVGVNVITLMEEFRVKLITLMETIKTQLTPTLDFCVQVAIHLHQRIRVETEEIVQEAGVPERLKGLDL